MLLAMQNVSTFTDREQCEVRGPYERAFESFRRGEDCADSWATMADALNMAETLSELGIASNEECIDMIARGQTVLADVAIRWSERKSWTLRPQEMQALEDALFVHTAQLRYCTIGEYKRALVLTHERIRQARTGNAPKGAIVIYGGIGREPMPA